MSDYLIQCSNLNELLRVCTHLTREGFLFKADTATLTVTLTGGY
jgi:hypothetical protein